MPKIIREDLSTSIAAQIGSEPIIYYFFGNFNFLSPLINVAVLWTVAPIMIIGGLGGALSFIFPQGSLVLQLEYLLTCWFHYIVSL